MLGKARNAEVGEAGSYSERRNYQTQTRNTSFRARS